MIAALEAVKTALAGLSYPTHLVNAPSGSVPPYLVLAPATMDRPEVSLTDESRDYSFPLRVTCVAATPDGALIMAGRALSLLSPGWGTARIPASGLLIETRWERMEAAGVDESVTIVGTTNRHPAYRVDTYSLSAISA